MERRCDVTLTKQQLIEDNMNLVYSLISKEYPTYLQDEDIVQCGMVGLCNAAEKWDESKSKFSTFAFICIRNEIRMELRRRQKHSGLLSLDYEVDGNDGERTSFGDFIVGDEDVLYIDTELPSLTDRERQVFELFQAGLTPKEVADNIGVSEQYVWKVMRKIRALTEWNYGN